MKQTTAHSVAALVAAMGMWLDHRRYNRNQSYAKKTVIDILLYRFMTIVLKKGHAHFTTCPINISFAHARVTIKLHERETMQSRRSEYKDHKMSACPDTSIYTITRAKIRLVRCNSCRKDEQKPLLVVVELDTWFSTKRSWCAVFEISTVYSNAYVVAASYWYSTVYSKLHTIYTCTGKLTDFHSPLAFELGFMNTTTCKLVCKK